MKLLIPAIIRRSGVKKKSSIFTWVAVVILTVLLVVVMATLLSNQNKPKDISYFGADGIMQKIENGEVDSIYIEGNYAYVLKKGSDINKKHFPKRADYRAVVDARFLEYFKEIQTGEISLPDGVAVPTLTLANPSSNSAWTSLIIPAVGLILLLVLFFVMYRQSASANGKALSFGKTKARLNTNVKVRFSDVAGAEEEKEELQEIVEFLKNPKKFSDLGARVPKGVLLVGPPGTGKTLFAKAVAGEANVSFFSISGSDFVEMFVGTGAARVRDLFDQAKKNMPCIIFIDEIDAVGRQRGAGLGGGNDEREQTLNQLLVQMDGFEQNDGIIIMAATNRADILDPALMRPGRFDRQIYVSAPDVKGREAIFKVHARNKPLAPDVSFKILARMTSGFTGADIENLLNEASILAVRSNRKVIVMEDILEGINKVIAGPQKKSRIVTETDKRITAYHEGGHAIVAKVLPNCDEVQEVSIIPRGMAAGYTLTRPETDDSHITKNKLLDTITMMLGGRAAEQIIIHDVSTGASNDIERASGIARKMVTEWGMSEKIGNMFLGGGHEVFVGKDYATQRDNSEEMSNLIDSEVKRILDECYAKALKILEEKRSVLDNMVKILFEKDTIYTDEVEMLFDGASTESIIEFIDKRNGKKDMYKKNDISAHIVDEKTDEQANAGESAKSDAEKAEPLSSAEENNGVSQSEGNDIQQ